MGNMARTLLGSEPVETKIHLHGSFAETGKGHGTDRAIVGGLLGMKPDDSHIPFAFDEAKERGLKYEIDAVALRDAHPNTAVIELTGADGKQLVMQASSIGGGRIVVNKLDGIDVNFTGNFNTRHTQSGRKRRGGGGNVHTQPDKGKCGQHEPLPP